MIRKGTYLGLPLAGRKNRRMLVLGYWMIVAFAAVVAATWFRYEESLPVRPHLNDIGTILAGLCSGLCFGWLLTALGGLNSRGPVSSFEPPPSRISELWRVARGWHGRKRLGEESALDERDIRLCNAAHYEAYKVVRGVALLLPVLIVLFGTAFRKTLWLAPPIGLVLLLVVFNLPQTLILWNEPDMEEPR